MNSENRIIFDNPSEGIMFDNQSLVQDNLYEIAAEAIAMSGVTDRLTIYFCENPKGKFWDYWNNDPGHLSCGTAIYLDTIFICPRAIRAKAFHDPNYYAQIKKQINASAQDGFEKT